MELGWELDEDDDTVDELEQAKGRQVQSIVRSEPGLVQHHDASELTRVQQPQQTIADRRSPVFKSE